MLKSYRASCHCGKVVMEADLNLGDGTYRCNCSICRRSRFWLALASPDGARLVSGKEDLTQYTFGSGSTRHYFCRHCGVKVFGETSDPSGQPMFAVNIGCVEGVSEEELSRLPITYVDGLHDRWDAAPEFREHI